MFSAFHKGNRSDTLNRWQNTMDSQSKDKGEVTVAEDASDVMNFETPMSTPQERYERNKSSKLSVPSDSQAISKEDCTSVITNR